MNKKQKLLVGLCVPAATLASAGAVVGIIAATGHAASEGKLKQGEYRVTFDCGKNAHFVNDLNKTTVVQKGTRMSNVKQPVVTSNVSKKVFTGWVDENGKQVTAKTPITRNMRLTATYNEITGNYKLITFTTNTQDERLFGNLSVAVKKGYAFVMVNRPTATAENKTFNGWYYLDSEGKKVMVTDDFVIEDNITLKPDFTSTVNVHWNTWCPGQVTEEEGEIIRGQADTRMTIGTQFRNFNQPQLSNGDKFFNGWANAKGEVIDPDTYVTSDMQAYALWGDPVAPADYTRIQFVTNPNQPEVVTEFSPQKYLMVKTYDESKQVTTTWGDVNTPTVSDTQNNWRISTHEEEVEGKTVDVQDWLYKDESGNWQVLDRSKKITEDNLEVCPVMVPAIDSVSILGSTSTFDVETTYTIQTDITGEAYGTGYNDIKWGIYYDQACENPVKDDPITIEQDPDNPQYGILKVGSINVYNKQYWIKATSTLSEKGTTPVSTKKQITINLPYVGAQDYWFYNDPNLMCNGKAGDGKWYKFKQAEISETGSTIVAYGVDDSETIIDKSATFSQNLYCGTKINIIQNNFLCNFTGFIGNVMLGDDTCNVTQIEGSFMEGCTSFNNAIDLSNITSIGGSFLHGCVGFSKPITFSESLTSIGNDFLAGCTHFNSAISFGTTPVITSIGESFLYNCILFNQDITFPASLTYVGPFCMYRCDDFTATVYAEAPVTAFQDSIYQFAAMSSDAAIANDGFLFDGTNAEAYKSKFPTYKQNYCYRGLATEATQITLTQWNKAIKAFGNDITKISTDTTAVSIEYQMPNIWHDKGVIEKNGTNVTENDISYAPALTKTSATNESILEMRNTDKELVGYASVANNTDFAYGRLIQFMSDYGLLQTFATEEAYEAAVKIDRNYHWLVSTQTGYALKVAFDYTDASGNPLITEINVYEYDSGTGKATTATGDRILMNYKTSEADDYVKTSDVTYTTGTTTNVGKVTTLSSKSDGIMNGWIVKASDLVPTGVTSTASVIRTYIGGYPISSTNIVAKIYDASTNTMTDATVKMQGNDTFWVYLPTGWATAPENIYVCMGLTWTWSHASTEAVTMDLA